MNSKIGPEKDSFPAANTTETAKIEDENIFELPGCPICLQVMNRGISTLPCGHCYHFECISRHLAEENFCPMCKGFASADQIILLYYLVVDKIKIMSTIIKPNSLLELFSGLGKNEEDKKYLQALQEHLNAIKKEALLKDEKVHYHVAQSQKYEWELSRMYGVAFRNEKIIEDLKKSLKERTIELQSAKEQKSFAITNMADLNDHLMRKIKQEGMLRLENQELRKSVFRLTNQVVSLKNTLQNISEKAGLKNTEKVINPQVDRKELNSAVYYSTRMSLGKFKFDPQDKKIEKLNIQNTKFTMSLDKLFEEKADLQGVSEMNTE